jgi:hypothetical protein
MLSIDRPPLLSFGVDALGSTIEAAADVGIRPDLRRPRAFSTRLGPDGATTARVFQSGEAFADVDPRPSAAPIADR